MYGVWAVLIPREPRKYTRKGVTRYPSRLTIVPAKMIQAVRGSPLKVESIPGMIPLIRATGHCLRRFRG